jgi:SAM-dependent methyltransferase
MERFSLGEFEFYWQVAQSGFSKLPNTLPFCFGTRHQLPYLLSRVVDAKDLEILRHMYTLESNVGYLQESNSLGLAYGEDLRSKINLLRISSESQFSRVPRPRILEIGCGGAAVLRQLSKGQMECFAIDPSPVAVKALSGSDVTLISDFYPNQLDGEQFDFLFCADVLEHVADPLEFLVRCRENLVDEGMLLVSVPDCTRSIEIGDVSMALHQHLSYFNVSSLKRILEDAGFGQVSVEAAKYGGSLYGTGIRMHSESKRSSNLSGDDTLLNDFYKKAANSVAIVQQELRKCLNDYQTIGIYVPLRILPYLGVDDELRRAISSFRLFDDTPTWQGKRVQEGLSPIENFSQLVNSPVSDLFVMSLTFGDTIARRVSDLLGSKISLRTLNSMII